MKRDGAYDCEIVIASANNERVAKTKNEKEDTS
jgi:hypothetical protein